MKLCICIPTYKRPKLLNNLIIDIIKQNIKPNILIIVDGDPSSGDVQRILKTETYPTSLQLIYIPSSFANKPYQLYLGFKAAKQLKSKIIIFLDDDLRIIEMNSIEKTIAPFFRENNIIVGVTANIIMGDTSKLIKVEILLDRIRWSGLPNSMIVRRFGGSKKNSPGGLSPTGCGRLPRCRGNDYEKVEWFTGGVMAFRMDALEESCFSENLFALFQWGRGGTGEDKFISRRVGIKGDLLFAFCANYEHPHDDLPTVYPLKAFKNGLITAYSRRLLNDDFRVPKAPLFSDKVALIKSYIGNILLNWWRALTALRPHRCYYAWGYSCGRPAGAAAKTHGAELDASYRLVGRGGGSPG